MTWEVRRESKRTTRGKGGEVPVLGDLRLVINTPPGSGKSTLAAHWTHTRPSAAGHVYSTVGEPASRSRLQRSVDEAIAYANGLIDGARENREPQPSSFPSLRVESVSPEASALMARATSRIPNERDEEPFIFAAD